MGPRRSRPHPRKRATGGHSRYGLSRAASVRPTLPVVVVVCDDCKTAVAYFTQLRRKVKSDVTLHVVKAPCHGATPDDVVTLAIQEAKQYRGRASHDREDHRESVWALIDLEGDAARQRQTHDAKKKGEEKNIQVALSNPCFEVWTLAHLVGTGESFKDCSEVLGRVKKEWKKRFKMPFGSKKAQADYAKLMPLCAKALESTKKRKPRNDHSWTDVWRVVEDIDQKICQYTSHSG